MRKVQLGKTGESIAVIGQGTWGIEAGFPKEYYEEWKASIMRGYELTMDHIDTAEIYGKGASEALIGELLKEGMRREDVFITSKLYPLKFTEASMRKAVDASLKRLGVDHFDLYLIHWPFFTWKKQLRFLESLVGEGKTRYIGVSNFPVAWFKKCQEVLKKVELVTNQLRASVAKQGNIKNGLPFYQAAGVTLTAYSPLAHDGLQGLKGPIRENLEKVANDNSVSIQQAAIAWLINQENVITIPKAFKVEHVESNFEAANLKLSDEEIRLLND